MSVDPHGESVLFGPMGLWEAFKFCVRLRVAGIGYVLCRNPRAVSVATRDLDAAAEIFEAL